MVTDIRKGSRPHLYIREWIDHFGLSDDAVAGRVGRARETIWRWANEQHRLNPEKIAALAHALDIEPEDFWRLPARRSVDAILKNQTDEMNETVVDIVQRLIRRAS
jgi:transcriptional regulator with XRE-family HTH domain